MNHETLPVPGQTLKIKVLNTREVSVSPAGALEPGVALRVKIFFPLPRVCMMDLHLYLPTLGPLQKIPIRKRNLVCMPLQLQESTGHLERKVLPRRFSLCWTLKRNETKKFESQLVTDLRTACPVSAQFSKLWREDLWQLSVRENPIPV